MAGPGPVLYLDVDDEITSAAARVRAVEGTRVALVVPAGSRIATSRINFRLLARDAGVHGRRLAIIAPDAASRALAAAAGLEVFASVAEYETAMGGGAPPAAAPDAGGPSGGAVGGAAVVGGAAAAGAAAVAGAAAAGSAGTAPTGAEGVASPADGTGTKRRRSRPPAPPTRPAEPPPATAEGAAGSGAAAGDAAGRASSPAADPASGDDLRPRSAAAGARSVSAPRRGGFDGRIVVAIVGLALAGLLVVGGVAAYLLLPSATIVVTPRVESVGPTEVSVTADPDATAVDVAAGVIPAERLTLDVQASGTYKATGKRVVETKASGTVRFTNCDFLAAQSVKAGSRVSTEAGIAFTTDDAIVIPAADFQFPNKVTCADRDVTITAVKAGTAGNVPADTITVVPGNLNPLAVRVRNRAPTEGGARESFPRVTEADVKKAVADLDAKLEAEFAALVADPATAPPGSTVFPATATLGDPVPDPDPASFVGQEVAEFELSATASGTVVAVDETPIADVADARIAAEIEPGYELVEGSVETRIGEPVVEGETVVFPVTVTALQVRQLDPDELEQAVLGLTPEEAVQALAPYGSAEITLTPDWATTIPTYDFRVEVTIAGGVEASPKPEASPEPEASPTTSPAPSSPSPDAS